jgi:hypothetical protein
METGKIIFCIIIAIWFFIGVVGGGFRAKENRVNYELMFFIIFSLFIPVIAKMCGLM